MFISENHIKYFAIGMGTIGISILWVVMFVGVKPVPAPIPVSQKAGETFSPEMSKICDVNKTEVKWKYIVLHHSATNEGNAANFDNYHRNKKKWKHGLAYHFVIGNGTQSGDGEIEVGSRWKKQIHGAHTSRMDYNKIAIGICLVGNFEDEKGPTEQQMVSLLDLSTHLCKKYDISLNNVIGHNEVQKNHTACPGKNFHFAEFKNTLLQNLNKEEMNIVK